MSKPEIKMVTRSSRCKETYFGIKVNIIYYITYKLKTLNELQKGEQTTIDA